MNIDCGQFFSPWLKTIAKVAIFKIGESSGVFRRRRGGASFGKCWLHEEMKKISFKVSTGNNSKADGWRGGALIRPLNYAPR